MTITRSADAARSRACSAKHAETNGQRRPEQRSGPTASSAQKAVGRLERELSPVAGVGRVEPALHRFPGAGVAAVGEEEGLEALQLTAAKVVRPPLQHLDANVAADRRRGDGDILREKLLLECLRRGRDDHAAPRLERRHEIRKALADAGAGLRDEMLAGLERVLDARRERGLLTPRLVPGKRMRERPSGAEDVLHLRQTT